MGKLYARSSAPVPHQTKDFDDVMPNPADVAAGLDDPGDELSGFGHAIVDAAQDIPHEPTSKLATGTGVADATLVELLSSGGGMVCWKATRPDGATVTVHGLGKDATDAMRDAFVAKASVMAHTLSSARIDGILRIDSIDSLAGAYLGATSPLGTMTDVPLLNWTVTQKLDFIRRIAETLQATHAQGLVHGCLRPETIVLDEDLGPVLANAGIYDIAAECKGNALATTKHRAYASPVVLDGHTADRHDDMYSIGRLLHFMLLGEDPTDFGEPIPRLASLTKAPPGLVRIVRRCTALDASNRYPSMSELLDDLSRYQRDEPVGLAHPEFDDAARFAKDAKRGKKKKADPDKQAASTAAPPTRTVVPGTMPPLLSRPLLRAGVFVIPGVGLIAGASFGAYTTAADHVAWTVVAGVGAILVGFAPPTFGPKKALSRLFLVAACAAAVYVSDPVRRAAREGSQHADLKADDPAERVEALRRLKREGHIDFSGVDLGGADLSGMDLARTSLDGAILRRAVFRGANLSGTSLINADVTEANFSGADLSGCNPDFTTGWKTAVCDSTTQMPQGHECVDGHPKPPSGKREK